ncbi:MAG: hypothetical protein EA402_12870 [Planctomycetota bacterium]|nr:MAG: hypothetical protein EA402_12870 [Planctomycetota bacterium]
MNPLSLVDPFHAVDGGGNCLPGPQLPFGLVRLGPDTVNHNTNGYASHEDLRHFSHLHVSGTGGEGRYGCIGVVPMGQYADARSSAFAMSEESASPGRYGVTIRQRQGFGELSSAGDIRCELTATHHCGVHRYTFSDGLDPHLRINLGACIGGTSVGGWARWQDERTLLGRADYRGGWGHNLPFSVFFRLEILGETDRHSISSLHHPSHSSEGDGPDLMVACRLPAARQIEVRVGMSLVSVAEAQRHLREECQGQSFDELSNAAAAAWSEVLGRATVQGGSEADTGLWYTLLQRLHAMPGDLGTAEVPWFSAQRRQFNDFYCLWDSVRCANSLFTLLDPRLAVDIANSLTEIGEQTGWIPDAWIMGGSAMVQGGCSAAVLFAEAAAKGLPGFDAKAALDALRATHESTSPSPLTKGRFPGWATQGFLDDSVINCCSRTVEYAFHDACAARLATAVGDEVYAASCSQRSEHIWLSWQDDARCFAPRNAEGAFVTFDPWRPQRPDFWNDPHYYEGVGHDYALTLWSELPKIVAQHGGREAFIAHLEDYCQRCYMWKEINLHAPWLFHWVGRPDLSSRTLRRIMDAHVRPGRKGLTDNEDMGAWSSWWLTGAMGLCPVPGSTTWLIGAPRFSAITLTPPGMAKPLRITTSGIAPGPEAVVIAASLNGAPLQRAWLQHHEIADGAELQLSLGTEPADWGSEAPPW